ncbi:DNA alkylation response protein [Pelagibaculum spongiae]|uniref:DNA alkylation response protein n=1 Tax=Pelagibaculum spongiae TaxID=2080658 RepID=A0A2V1GRD4_9GAMM|nr:DNA alkylation response protein [Pelagibaculum spongiae]
MDDLLMSETHQVFNQPTALEDYNSFTSDIPLQHWLKVFYGDWAVDRLQSYGEQAGGSLLKAGFLANENAPTFETHDRFGHRVDQVNFHPAYHQLMNAAITADMPALPWKQTKKGAHVARAAMEYLHMQADAGSGCPLTMTFAAVPAISHQSDIAEIWLPKILSGVYDPRNIPWYDKKGVTIGMAMTEKQGGSDVRANTTIATPLTNSGGGQKYSLTGHKWFCSAPMCDAFLVLAQTDGGLSCFLVPRWREDGSKNGLYFQRLKNKLGNISNASSEVEYRDAHGWMLGEEGRGVRTIIEMVSMTRFDCMVGSSALMRASVAQAIHHTSGRSAFGKNLHQQPLMQNVLADLALESEAALAMTLRVGHALDMSQQSSADAEQQGLFARIATAVGKYWICKRAPHLSYEAMEAIGGVGYVEQNIMSRIYREAPVNAIWEGSGNIQCLDVIRAIQKEPACLEAFFAELNLARGENAALDNHIEQLKSQFDNFAELEVRGRTVVDHMATALQAATLIRFGDPEIAQAYIASRISGPAAASLGSLPAETDFMAIIKRAMPQV